MTSITIITIVVVALLTTIIFCLTWLAYSSCLKIYKLEVSQGKHDDEILSEYRSKKKSRYGLVGTVCSYLVLITLIGLFSVGVVYKVRGENLSINNQTVLVIKSESMSDYYNDELALEYRDYPKYHFDIGDICVFESLTNESSLVEGEVYGYKYKDIIVTHRLVKIHKDDLYEFRGDNNSTVDPYYIRGENIIYHYTGQKVPGVGAFILYAQSYFGILSLVGIVGVLISSEVVYHKIDKINKERDKVIVLKNKPQETTLDLTREKFSRFVAFILDKWPKDCIESQEDTAFWRVCKEIWPQLREGPTAETPSKTHEEEEGV